MRASAAALVCLTFVTACGKGGGETAQADGNAATPAAATSDAGAGSPGAEASSPSAATTAPGVSLAGRTRELGNPDDFTMVLLYYSLSGATPPIDKWVENDTSVRFAQPIDKPAARDALRAKILAGLAAAKDVGSIRLTMDASLSDFDPSYNEYTIRALAPSSVVTFRQFDQQVSVKFDNAETAQHWSVDPKQAQAIRDKVQYGSGADIDVLVKITGAIPDAQGGTITTQVVSYELKSHRDGTTYARVKI